MGSYSCASWHRVFACSHIRKLVTAGRWKNGWSPRMPVVTPKLWDFSLRYLRFRFLLRATDVTPSFHFANLCTGNPWFGMLSSLLSSFLPWPRHEVGILFWVRSLDQIFCLHWRGSLRHGPIISHNSAIKYDQLIRSWNALFNLKSGYLLRSAFFPCSFKMF